MCKSTVSLSHAVHILLTLEGTTLVVVCIHNLRCEFFCHTLTATLSSRNITWNDWEQGIKGAILQKGWLDYCDKTQNSYAPKRLEQINSTALSKVFNKLISINKDGKKPTWPLKNSDLGCAIVVQWGQIPVFNGTTMRMEDDRSRVAISLRTTRRAGDLFAQPIFYTEVHFQGDQKELKE